MNFLLYDPIELYSIIFGNLIFHYMMFSTSFYHQPIHRAPHIFHYMTCQYCMTVNVLLPIDNNTGHWLAKNNKFSHWMFSVHKHCRSVLLFWRLLLSCWKL